MAKLNKIRVIKFAKFQSFLLALLGFLAGFLYSFGGLIIDTLVSIDLITSNETPGLSYGTILAFGALIGMPMIFAIFGFLLGFIEAALYNLFVTFFEANKIDFYS
jgi:hypothetical protein